MRHQLILAATLLAAIGRVLFPGTPGVRFAMLPLLALLLTACGSTPPALPPPPTVTVYECVTPAGLTERETQPLPPMGDYSQEDVALFITDLHQWGARGWLRVARIREHADKCAQSAEDEDDNRD